MILLWLFECGVVVFKILCFFWKFVCVFSVGKIFVLFIQKCEKCNLRKSGNLRMKGRHNLRKIDCQFQNLKAFLFGLDLWSHPSSWNIHDEKNRSHALLFCVWALCVMYHLINTNVLHILRKSSNLRKIPQNYENTTFQTLVYVPSHHDAPQDVRNRMQNNIVDRSVDWPRVQNIGKHYIKYDNEEAITRKSMNLRNLRKIFSHLRQHTTHLKLIHPYCCWSTGSNYPWSTTTPGPPNNASEHY